MTVIQILSDIHIEFGDLDLVVEPDTDVLVIAGDLAPGKQAIEFLQKLRTHTPNPIVYIPGNHCFWDEDLALWPTVAKQLCSEINVNFLYNETVIIKDVAFIGTTLWTDFKISGNQVLKMMQAVGYMLDYKYIKFNGDKITPEIMLDQHTAARAFLQKELAQYRDMQTCVVTHHAPSSISLGDRERNKFAAFYASDLSELILNHGPDVWIHGHIHSSSDYVIGDTLVYCNPRGYVGHHLNPNFNSRTQLEF